MTSCVESVEFEGSESCVLHRGAVVEEAVEVRKLCCYRSGESQ